MRKLFIIMALIIGFFGFQTAQANDYQIQSGLTTKRIPAGTTLEIEMATDISTEILDGGEMFSAYLTRDVRTETTMILPRGTIVRGNIKDVVPSKRLYRPASLSLNFDHIVAPNGSQLPIRAGLSGNYLLSTTGGIMGGVNYAGKVKQNTEKSGSIVKRAVNWGLSSGEDWFSGGKYLVTPFSTIGGVIGGAGYLVGESVIDLFKKGDNVVIKKGEIMNILLLEPLDVPVSE